MKYHLDGVLTPLTSEARNRLVYHVLAQNERLREWDTHHAHSNHRHGYNPRPYPGTTVEISADAIALVRTSLEEQGKFGELSVLYRLLGDDNQAKAYADRHVSTHESFPADLYADAYTTLQRLEDVKWWPLARSLALELGRADKAADYTEKLMELDSVHREQHRADARELRRKAGHYPRALELTPFEDHATRYLLLEEMGDFLRAAHEARKSGDTERAGAYESIAEALGLERYR